MNLCNIGHSFVYELEKLIRIFLPNEKIKMLDSFLADERYVLAKREIIGDKALLSVEVSIDGDFRSASEEIATSADDFEKLSERRLAVLIFDCFCSITDYIPKWGILTGVRPAKLYSRLASSMGEAATERYFSEELKVENKKISLCKECFKGEESIVAKSGKRSFSLYISIPFCPSRCSYCSFVSHSVEGAKKLIPQYVELLCEEIKATADYAKRNKLSLKTVYIGGGTPTTLSHEQLDAVMGTVRENFDFSDLCEYTVEAGRPDTVTAERLLAIKRGGATRISINPQTMVDSVLETIGRRHTAKATVDAFTLARRLGCDNINMDLIAGLPSDDVSGFCYTLDEVLKLDPESVTVHSLSMKRSAGLSTSGAFPELSAGAQADKMVSYARDTLSQNGILPYYMYRQSKTVGNLENVGYAKTGYECLYNVYIMDETHSILACGASAVTKLREIEGDYIERIFNFKYPYEYISRFDEIIARKRGIDNFYREYGSKNNS